MLYSLSILLLEGLRANSTTWLVGIRVPQVIVLVALLIALYIIPFYSRQLETDDDEQSGQLVDRSNILQAGR